MKTKHLLILCMIIFLASGCFKKDTLENAVIYTTNYPIEYITQRLYGDNGIITSIYPIDVDIKNYSLTDKQLTDYSKGKIFIYNGLSNEKNYALSMINKNKGLLIIDAAMSMEYNNEEEEIWLDPSNFLMMGRNIKEGFKEYITNVYLAREIEENYEKFKIDISEVDAEIKLIASNAIDKNILVADDILLYLSKYGLNVFSLEENDNLTAKKINDIEKLINEDKIKYIFVKDNDKLNKTAQLLVNTYKITPLSFKVASNLSEEERNDKVDFIKIMNENIEALKKELYQ